MLAVRHIRRRTMRTAQAAARAVLACACCLLAGSLAVAQQSASVPILTVPTGEPPAPAGSTITIEEAISAVLNSQSTGAGGAATLPAPPVGGQPRPNPFASPPPAPVEGNLLLPFNPAQAADNVKVSHDADGLITLAVREGSLRQVVAMIAETQKLNIVFAGANDTTVTAAFDRQPWQTVLDSLASASGHTWTTRGDVIFIASLEVADFMPPDAGGQQVEVFELDFASAVDLDQTIKGLLSPAGRSWVTESDSKDNRRTKEAVAVIDYPAYLARISQYICQADQPPRQVFIQAHVLQVELSDKCRNGVNFENIIRTSSTPIRLRNIGFASAAPTSAFLLNVDGDGVNGLDGVIELLQNTVDAKTLASPEIHAVSGEFSRLQIGEQLPYKSTATTQTASLESVQFLDVGVVLEVTPRVTRDGRVLMRIKPEVSSGAFLPDAGGLPSKKTSQVETDVLMASGEAIVIGGLIQETDSNLQSKIPWLGDIPYLGILFQKRDVELTRKEIIITLRPYVLPYTPIIQEMQDEKIFRAEQPLTQGAICEYPRPYEPHMPDTFDHAKYKHQQKQAAYWTANANSFGDGELHSLPPVEEVYGDAIEELPEGAVIVPEGDAPILDLPENEPALR